MGYGIDRHLFIEITGTRDIAVVTPTPRRVNLARNGWIICQITCVSRRETPITLVTAKIARRPCAAYIMGIVYMVVCPYPGSKPPQARVYAGCV